jgi:hypothetical protein
MEREPTMKVYKYLRMIALAVIFNLSILILQIDVSANEAVLSGGGAKYGVFEKHGQEFLISADAWIFPQASLNGIQRTSTDLATGFEVAEGFTANQTCAQNGWGRFVASTTQGRIETAHPAEGSQHVRISHDPALKQDVLIGCGSPDLGVQEDQPSVAEVNIAVSASGGADYDFVLQALSQELITARVKFSYTGDIRVVDDDGSGGLVYYDTGSDWVVGPYKQLRVELDPGTQNIKYYYDQVLIYTGSIFAGTSFEQAILMADNYHVSDVGDFDDVSIKIGGGSSLDAPTNLNATAVSKSQINLIWQDNSTDETAFHIERSPDGNNWSKIATVGANVTSYSDTGLECDTSYHYRIRAYRAGDQKYSAYSDPPANEKTKACAWTLFLPIILIPEFPPAVAPIISDIVDDGGDGTYQVSWTAVAGTASYVLEEDVNPAFSSPTTAYSGPGTSTNITVTQVGTYYYRVKAVNSVGQSGWSNVESVQVELPGAPQLENIDNPDGMNSYTLNWSSVSTAAEYIIQEDDNDSFSSPSTVYTGSETTTNISVQEMGTYFYRVQAANALGSGPWSNTVSTTVTSTAVVPKPGLWSGDADFMVSSDSTMVEWFEIDVFVPLCLRYVTIRWTNLPIADGKFSKGEFDTPTTASGSTSWSYLGCGGLSFGTFTWTSSWDGSVQADDNLDNDIGQPNR